MLGKSLDRSSQKKPRRPRTKAETEKRRRLFIVTLIVLAVVSSVAVVGYGYYDTSVKPWRQPILKVNGTTFDMRYFVKTLRINGLTSSQYAEYAVEIMEGNELRKQYLKSEFPDVDLGAVMSDEAVHAELAELMGLTDNYTQEEYDQQYQELVTNLKTYELSAGDLRDLYIEPSLISKELQKQIGDRDYPAADNHDHARVQALLVTGADNASLMRTKWENGVAFDTLAEEAWVSDSVPETETDNTTPKWVAREIQSTTFDNYTFNMPLGMLGDPVQDGDGSGNYWLINVLAREARQLSESDRDTLVTRALEKWLEEAKTSPDNVFVNYLNEEGGAAKLAWAVEHAEVGTS
jgi:hypothetical protein